MISSGKEGVLSYTTSIWDKNGTARFLPGSSKEPSWSRLHDGFLSKEDKQIG